MSFDPIANGWRKLLNRSTETKTVLTGTLEEGRFEVQEKSDIVAGKMYTLTLTDGRESLVVGTAVTKEISGTVCGGNLYLLMGENKDELDTGEHFAFCTADGYTGVFVEGVNNPDFTLTTTETVHTIEPKYLPVVKFTTPCPADYSVTVALTAEESAQLDAYAKAHLPVVVDLELAAFEGMRCSIMCTLMYFEGAEHFYGANFGEVKVSFGTDGSGTWFFSD